MKMKHSSILIKCDDGTEAKAQAPVIVSASRATDIPAFYADWFFSRLEKGYARWRNPFSGQYVYVSFASTRFIVFWSKNPAPLIPYLSVLKEKGIGCYIQYTLNDYESELLEPGVPTLSQRIQTFRQLVDILGTGAVVWRFDPLILTDEITVDVLLAKISRIADQLCEYTEKLVFSFADIAGYKKVGRNLSDAGVRYREWDEPAMHEFARKLSAVNQDRWQLGLATCAETIDLSDHGICHNRCIDPELIARLTPDDLKLQSFLFGAHPDSGQRKACGCILSKDIGAYNTCPHGCKYCYANATTSSAIINYNRHISTPNHDTLV